MGRAGGASAATTAGSCSTAPGGEWRRTLALRPLPIRIGPSSDRHERIREHLFRRGASFYREVYAAAGGGTDREVLDALWDLVWSGEVTNDTFAPLRALRWKRPGRDARRRPGRLTSLGPPEAAGRWSLVEPRVRGARARPPPSVPTPWRPRCSSGTGS